MKKIIILSALTFFIISAFAQDPVFKWGPLIDKASSDVKYEGVKIFGTGDKGFFVLNSHMPADDDHRITISVFNPILTVEYYDQLLKRSFTRDVTPGRSDDYAGTVYFNNALYVLTANYSKDDNKNILMAKGVLPGGGEAKSLQIGKITGPKFSQRGSFKAVASPDGTKLLVLSQQEYDKTINEKFTLTLFNKDFSQVWEKEISYDFPWSGNASNEPYVNNNGTAFIYKKIDLKGSDARWSIFTYNGTALKEFKIFPDDDKRITSTVQGFSPEGDFVYSGFFSGNAKVRLELNSPVKGTFLYRVDAVGQVMNIAAINPFDTRKGLVAKNIVFSDKNTILCSERYSVTDKAVSTPPGSPSTMMFARDYTYTSGEMSFDAFDETGKPLYTSTQNRRVEGTNNQNATGDFMPVVAQGKFRLLFNDSKASYGSAWIVFNPPMVIVQNSMSPATGKMDNAMFVANPGPVGDKKGDTEMRPGVYYKIDDTHYVVRAENDRFCRMGVVSF